MLQLRRGGREPLRDYWRRLARIACVSKPFANLVHDLRYRAITVKLGGSLRPRDHPAAKHIRYLRRCRKALGTTRFLEIDGLVEWAPRKDSVYQQISIEQITRAAEYAHLCPHIQILNAEILDSHGDRQSDRRAIMAGNLRREQELADEGTLEFGVWRSMGIEMEDEEERGRSERQKKEDEEDKEDGEEAPPPKELPAVESLVIENTYHTTPSAMAAIIALLPNLTSLTLDGVHWQPNQREAAAGVQNRQIQHLTCLDVTYDQSGDDDYEMDNEMNPTFPMLLRLPELMKNLRTLHLGYRDRSWTNDSDILSWSRIPLRTLERLQTMTLSTTIEIEERGDTIRFFFQAVANLIRAAPHTLNTLDIALLPGATEEHSAIDNIRARHWRSLREAIPTHVTSLTITFAVSSLLPLPHNMKHEILIREAFNGERGVSPPRIRYTTRQEWHRGRAPTTSETFRIRQ